MKGMLGMLAALASIMASAPRGAPSRNRAGTGVVRAAGSKAVRRMVARRNARERWESLFRSKSWKPVAEDAHKPSKRQEKRDYIAVAQQINPAIKTFNGALKLDRRLAREAERSA